MPYIKQFDRNELEPNLSVLIDNVNDFADPEKDGVLNYVISRIVTETLGVDYDSSVADWSYRDIARGCRI
jgi:hypothetical protein